MSTPSTVAHPIQNPDDMHAVFLRLAAGAAPDDDFLRRQHEYMTDLVESHGIDLTLRRVRAVYDNPTLPKAWRQDRATWQNVVHDAAANLYLRWALLQDPDVWSKKNRETIWAEFHHRWLIVKWENTGLDHETALVAATIDPEPRRSAK